MKTEIPILQRLGCSVKEAAALTSIGRTKIYELLDAGELEGRSIGGRRVVLVRSLKKLMDGDRQTADAA
jgi:excisionase family DNA binding protein